MKKPRGALRPLVWVPILLGILAITPLAYILISHAFASPCEDIFRQTRMILDSKLEPVQAKGGLLLEEAVIRSLSERSEIMAMNFKSCCIALQEDKITSAEFLGCKESMRDYEAKVDQVARELDEAEAAARNDDAEARQESLAQVRHLVEEARSSAEGMLQHVRDASVQVGQASSSRTQPTSWPGVVAEVTRFADTGGMLTLEVEFRNTIQESVKVSPNPADSYLIDEMTGDSWGDSFNSGWVTVELAPGQTHLIWMKFKVEPPFPEYFTAVIAGVARPVERLTLDTDA